MAFVLTVYLEAGVVFYLENNVGRVVDQHHQSAHPHIVGNVGETDENYGGNMMNHLLLEILKHKHTCMHAFKNMQQHKQQLHGCRLKPAWLKYQMIVCTDSLV